jgi:hypothetical protein
VPSSERTNSELKSARLPSCRKAIICEAIGRPAVVANKLETANFFTATTPRGAVTRNETERAQVLVDGRPKCTHTHFSRSGIYS